MVLSDEEQKAKRNALQKAYRARPEVRAKLNEKNKERMREYNKRPEVLTRTKEYNARPEVKARKREHYAKPEAKAQMKKYRSSPEGKAKRKEYYTSPKVKAKKKEYYKRPEVKARLKEYEARPERIAKRRERDATPERKAKQRAREARPEARVRRKMYRDRPEIKARTSKYAKDKKDKERMEVYLHYSKIHSNSDIPCCRCCGLNSHVEFLSLDHIAGKKQMDSESELVKLGYSSKFKIHVLILWVIKNNFPDGFQILCLNCNFAKGHSKDNTCPHERN